MLSLLAGVVMGHETSAPPSLPREFRGVWVATVDNIDWPSEPGLPAATQKKQLKALLVTAAGAHFNAILLQVRPSADALYESKLEPSSWYLTGQEGKRLEFDPLAYAVTEGHRLGLEVHAWINPFRACHPAQKGPYSADHVSQTHPEWVKAYGKYKWMDPGDPGARKHSYDVVMDILDRYDVDGIHIDDYFYPYPEGGQPFPDQDSYAKYGVASGLGLSDWRRSNIDGFVQTLYKGIKAKKPWVKFGISPFGIYRPNVPEGVTAGVDQFEDLAADALKWLQQGWCDYMSPQIYWTTETKGHAFGTLMDWWAKVNTKGRHLWPGLYTSQLASSWTTVEITKQIGLTRIGQGTNGQVHFSAKALTKDYKGLREALLAGPYKEPALVPASPWLPTKKPTRLTVRLGQGEASWEPNGSRFFVVWERTSGDWRFQTVTSDTSVIVPTGSDAVAVSGISTTGTETEPVVVPVPGHN